MRNNRLKVNESNIEYLVIGSQSNRKKANIKGLQVGETVVESTASARNLGVTIDENLSLRQRISEVVRGCRFAIKQLWHIRKYLTADTAKTIVHAVIISKLDFCNSLYLNLPDTQIRKLQSVMNETARLVTLTPRKHSENGTIRPVSITPILQKLHWLPVAQRIEYKVLTTAYKAMSGSGQNIFVNYQCHSRLDIAVSKSVRHDFGISSLREFEMLSHLKSSSKV